MTQFAGPDTEGYFETWSGVDDDTHPAFAGAYRKGVAARRDGIPRVSNPYFDHRTARGSITFSRSFRRWWWRGWDHENKRIRESA